MNSFLLLLVLFGSLNQFEIIFRVFCGNLFGASFWGFFFVVVMGSIFDGSFGGIFWVGII